MSRIVVILFLAGLHSAPLERGAAHSASSADRGSADIVWMRACAVDSCTGRVVWTVPSPSVSLVLRGSVVLLYEGGLIECRELKDGDLLWARVCHGAEQSDNDASLIALHHTHAGILRTGRGRIELISSENGEMLWSTIAGLPPRELEGRRRQVVVSESAFLVMTNASMSCHALSGGSLLWRIEQYVRTAIFTGDGDIISLSDNSIARLRARDGAEVWRIQNKAGCPLAHVWLVGDFLIAGTSWPEADAQVLCCKVRDGDLLWRCEGEYLMAAHAAQNAGEVILCTRSRTLRSVGIQQTKIANASSSWRMDFESCGDAVVMLVEGDSVLLAFYESLSCGVDLLCVSNGKLVWREKPKGIQVSHSCYSHRVELRKSNGVVIVAGRTLVGDYVETYCIDGGALLARWSS